MKPIIAFDIYGTLIDVTGVTEGLKELVGDNASAFSQHWRTKQLEYTFRKAAMSAYQDFRTCTREAFAYVCLQYGITPSEAQTQKMLALYLRLPAFQEVGQALQDLHQQGAHLWALSNGLAQDIVTLLEFNGLEQLVNNVVSVDEIKTFKPDPRVYKHFMQRSACEPGSGWLISSNPFDVIGAQAAGMKGIWVKRHASHLFDPWEVQPSAVVTDLSKITNLLQSRSCGRSRGRT